MKNQILATFCVLALAVSAWGVKILMESGSEKKPTSSAHAKSAVIPPEGKAPGRMTSFHNESGEGTRMSSSANSGSAENPQQTISSSQPTLSAKPVANPATPADFLQESGVSPAVAAGSTPSPDRSVYVSTGTPPPAGTSPGGYYAPASNADPGVLEVDHGVPFPAAALPSQGNQSPAAAAAQQQLANSFVQNVNAAVNQPGITAAAASDSYYQALDLANEQFRALYGNEAYNAAVMKATLDAAK